MYLKGKLAALAVGSAAALALAGGPVVAGIAPGGGGIGIRAALPAGFHAGQVAVKGATQVGSTNWSGYAQVGKKKKVFTAVKGFWTVPTVKVKSGTQYSSDWVGIDGAFNNTTLIQDGTEGDNIGGKVKYDAWTEIIPASEVVTPLVIKAGNKMEGLVQETATNKWVMTVMDLTTGKSFSKSVSYTTPQQDVEAVHERPEVGGSLATLAATTNVTQLPDDYSTTAPGKTPVWIALGKTVAGATLDQIFMVNNGDTAVIASPSALNSAKDGFTVADGATSPPPPS
jgi:hypothetical protein